MSIFQHNPFPVEAQLNETFVCAYAYPKELLEPLIPYPLTLDLYQDKWAFVAVAIVKTTSLRPAFLPKWLGNDFHLIGYRIFVRYTNQRGKKLRGLFILGSQTDNPKIYFLGNIITSYKYTLIDFAMESTPTQMYAHSQSTGLSIRTRTNELAPALPQGSPFASWDHARRFAGPLPFTFSVHKDRVQIVEGARQSWVPKSIGIEEIHVPFIDQDPLFSQGVLANAFAVYDVPYRWKKGVSESINR